MENFKYDKNKNTLFVVFVILRLMTYCKAFQIGILSYSAVPKSYQKLTEKAIILPVYLPDLPLD